MGVIIDWMLEALGDAADGGAYLPKACGMAYSTAEGMFTGTMDFFERLIWE